MRKVTFFGRVIPETSLINLHYPVNIEYRIDAGIAFIGKYNIRQSALSIIVEFDEYLIDIVTLKNQMNISIQSNVDAIGFIDGAAYIVELSGYIFDDTGEADALNMIAPIDAFIEPIQATDIFTVWRSDGYFQAALGNFREAIRSPRDTSFYCFRAIENLRQVFDQGTSKATWDLFRASLCLNEATIREITPIATALRHGSPQDQPWELRKRHIEITREVMRRFVIYRKEGSQPLKFNLY